MKNNLTLDYTRVFPATGEESVDAREIMGKMGNIGDPGQALYDRDFYEWSVEQATKLRSREWRAVDWENVAEEIESLGRSDRRELFSRLEVVLVHLLKWMVQPDLRCGSWRSTILEQRSRIATVLDDSPSLRSRIADAIGRKYLVAKRKAVAETGLISDVFPAECPFTPEQILDYDYLPD